MSAIATKKYLKTFFNNFNRCQNYVTFLSLVEKLSIFYTIVKGLVEALNR
jgi:hypothetical protein